MTATIEVTEKDGIVTGYVATGDQHGAVYIPLSDCGNVGDRVFELMRGLNLLGTGTGRVLENRIYAKRDELRQTGG